MSYLISIFLMTGINSTNDITYTEDVKPLFQRYCVSCHEGSLNYETSVLNKDKIFSKVVNLRKMPPKYVAEQPSDVEVEIIKKWILTGTKK